jgi:hypothetical protein
MLPEPLLRAAADGGLTVTGIVRGVSRAQYQHCEVLLEKGDDFLEVLRCLKRIFSRWLVSSHIVFEG